LSALLLCTLHSGCAVLGSKEAAAGCQVADVATTHYALHHNPNAVEQNGIPVPALDVIKLRLLHTLSMESRKKNGMKVDRTQDFHYRSRMWSSNQ